MSNKGKRTVLPMLLAAIAVFGAVGFAVMRTANSANRRLAAGLPVFTLSQEAARNRTSRNLTRQPDAARFARRMGRRFAALAREQSVLTGTLTIGNEQHMLSVTRKQTDRGEQIEIALAGAPALLTWDSDRGALTGTTRAAPEERALIERLVLDSPDQFVLAQLRGASYQTVGSEVRPARAADDYAGPRWNIVRVDDPDRDTERRPQSPWRLYYFNTATGLIDRVASQLQGVTIEAEISGWTDYEGEKVPSQIRWIRQGQTIMQYRLTGFSHRDQ